MSTTRRNFLASAALGTGLTFIPSWLRAGINGSSPNADLQLGIIGCGRQAMGLGRHLVRIDGVRIVAACDVYPAKLEAFVDQRTAQYAEEGKAASDSIASYDDYRRLIEHPGLDGVVIITPDHQHAPMCVAALERGLHVYCEKPLAHTIEEGRAMVEATEKSGKVLQTGSMQRSMFNFRHAVDLIQAGKLGELKEAIVSVGPPPRSFDLEEEKLPEGLDWERWIGPSVYRPYNHILNPPPGMQLWGQWRRFAEFGGGMVTDWGAHMFDIVQWALDRDDSGPTKFFPPGGDDPAEGMTLFYEDGFKVTHRQFGRGNAVRFVGSEGTLDVSRGFIDSSIPNLVQPAPEADRSTHHNVAHFQDWFDAIRSGSEVLCSAETGHRTSSICTLTNIAYRLQQPVFWNPKKERVTNNRKANRLLGPDYRHSLA